MKGGVEVGQSDGVIPSFGSKAEVVHSAGVSVDSELPLEEDDHVFEREYTDMLEESWRKAILEVKMKELETSVEVAIEETKAKLLATFNKAVKTLRSTDVWLNNRGALKSDIVTAVTNINEAFYKLDVAKIPQELLRNFRMDLGKKLSESRLVFKFCDTLKMHPKKHKDNDSTLNPGFRTCLCIIWNFSDVCDTFAVDCSEVDGFLLKMAQILRDSFEPIEKKKICKADEELVNVCLEILHNLASVDRPMPRMSTYNFSEILQPYLTSKDESLSLTALACLSDIADEEESEILLDDTVCVDRLLHRLDTAIIDPMKTCDGWTTKELGRTVRRLARNDPYKRVLVEHRVLPMLVSMGQGGNTDEQAEAVGAIWILSFNEENQKNVAENDDAMNLLLALRISPYPKVAKCCNGAIWTLRKTLQKSEKYRDIGLEQDKPVTSRSASALGDADSPNRSIVISYHWTNKKTVSIIRNILNDRGYTVWSEEDQYRGSSLQAVAEGIENAFVVLVCMSQKYKDSPTCRAEAEYADKRGKTIIPLRMEHGYKPDGWLGALIGLRTLFDFSGKYPFKEKMRALYQHIGEQSPDEDKLSRPVSFKKITMKRQSSMRIIAMMQQSKDVVEVPRITLKQLNEMKRMFEFYDQNDDNRLSTSELGSVLQALGQNPTKATIKEVMEKADADGNGYIDYSEYVTILKSYLKPVEEIEQELREAFKKFQKKHSQKLNLKRLKKALTYLAEPLSEAEAAELFKLMDQDRDGLIDVEEFTRYLCDI